MREEDRLGSVGEANHGVVSRHDIAESGLTRQALAIRLSKGSLLRIGKRTYRHRGTPIGEIGRALAAVLDTPGRSYLSHTSAAWLWDIPGFDLAPIHVARDFDGTREAAGADFVHNLRGVPAAHVGQLRSVPVASPTLMLFQIAAICHPARTERAVDNAIKIRLTDPGRLHTLLGLMAARGRNGIRTMRKILKDRPPDYRPPESGQEARFQEILRGIGVEAERQVHVGSENAFLTRVDFRDELYSQLVYRVQSERWHTAVSHARDDSAQLQALVDAGFHVVDIWDTDLWSNRQEVERRILRARATLSVGGNDTQGMTIPPTKRIGGP